MTEEPQITFKRRFAAETCPDPIAIVIAASTQTRIDLDTKTDMPRDKATRTPTAQLMAHAQLNARRRTQHRACARHGPDAFVIGQSGGVRVSCPDLNPVQR